VIAMQTHEEALREGGLSESPPGVPSRLNSEKDQTGVSQATPGTLAKEQGSGNGAHLIANFSHMLTTSMKVTERSITHGTKTGSRDRHVELLK
jgi:hypothetical protein